jgi:hypothetical protein
MPKGVWKRTQEHKDKLKPIWKNNLGKFCAGGISSFEGKKHSDETKKKIGESREYPKGEKHWHWKKDRSELVKRQERNDSAYFAWRREVWARDNFKCKIANEDCGGRLEAHHILGWSSHPELRYQINNGITLCHAHHPRKRDDEIKMVPIFKTIIEKNN